MPTHKIGGLSRNPSDLLDNPPPRVDWREFSRPHQNQPQSTRGAGGFVKNGHFRRAKNDQNWSKMLGCFGICDQFENCSKMTQHPNIFGHSRFAKNDQRWSKMLGCFGIWDQFFTDLKFRNEWFNFLVNFGPVLLRKNGQKLGSYWNWNHFWKVISNSETSQLLAKNLRFFCQIHPSRPKTPPLPTKPTLKSRNLQRRFLDL